MCMCVFLWLPLGLGNQTLSMQLSSLTSLQAHASALLIVLTLIAFTRQILLYVCVCASQFTLLQSVSFPLDGNGVQVTKIVAYGLCPSNDVLDVQWMMGRVLLEVLMVHILHLSSYLIS